MRTLPPRISKTLVRLRMITTTALLFSAATMFGGTVAEGSTTSAAVTTSTGRLTCKPSTLNFGSITLGHARSMTVTITNTGSSRLTVTKRINVAPGFWLSNLNLPLILNVGRSVQFYAHFHPSAIGPASGHIYLISNASNPKLTITLSGTGAGGNSLAPNPSSIGFGSVQIGKSLTRYETLTNSGISSITVSNATISGSGFSRGGLSLPLTLAAGHSVTFSVTFTPKAGGTASGSISVNSSASNSTLKVNLTGTGGSPSALAITTASLPKATVGTAYSATLSASGGTSPYRWTLASGHLPAGLVLASTGVISGKPTTAGSSTLTFQVSDSASAVAKAGYTFNVGSASSNTIVWSANMETANLSQWTINGTRGGSYDSGACTRPPNGVTTEHAHSGFYSMKMTINTSLRESGCRQFRNQEPESGGTYYYGAWFYVPEEYLAANYWNIFQFKSNNGSTEDPFWVVDLMPGGNGTAYLMLRWKGMVPGPYVSDCCKGTKYYSQTKAKVPIGRWFHIEAYLKQASAASGHLTIWQDGVLLWDMVNVKTKYPGGDQRWSTNNYSDRLTPNPAIIYVDDATISTQRVGP